MSEAGTIANAPLFGEAALQAAFAELGRTHTGSPAKGQRTVTGYAQSHIEPPKTIAQVLGEIVWLMTQSPRHEALALRDLEWLVMPVVLLRQFRIFYRGEQPAGAVIWALADELVAKRIDAGDKRLSAMEWESGTNMQIIDVVAPFAGESEMRRQLKAS